MRAMRARWTAGVIAIVTIVVAPSFAPSLAAAQDATASQDAASSQRATISRGVVVPGYELAVAPRGGAPLTLCAPDCELTLPRGEVRLGWRRHGEIEWQRDLFLDRDLRVDVRVQDFSALRGAGHALLIAAGVLIGATAIVGIATEPEPPDHGWFGQRHGLAFAAITGGIVLALGVPGIALSLLFEQDAPGLELVPED